MLRDHQKLNHLRTLLLLLLWTFCLTAAQGQSSKRDLRASSDRFSGKLDVGLNVTSVLSSFSGNGNFLEPQNLPLLLRFGKKANIRLGLGLSGSTSDFFDQITSSFRESTEQEFFVKLGFQQNVLEEGKWDFYVGLDVLGQYVNNKVNVFGQQSAAVISKRTVGGGVSPFAGIKFYLGKRIYLSSEANFTFLYAQNKSSESTITGGSPVIITSAERFSVSPPLFLYLNYKL